MPKFVCAFVFVAASLALPPAASAQEPGKLGVTMGFPESVGILWHATEKVALRPEFSFEWSSTGDDTADINGHVFSTGISLLYYVGKHDRLSTYVSPRYSFGRASTSFESDFSGERTTVSHNHLFSGSFGAQYWLSDRFSVFGELGLDYRHTNSENDFSDDETNTDGFGTRSAVGIVFYFK